MLKKILILFTLLFTFSIAVCAQQKFVANLSALQVVPPNSSSPGKGVCLATLDQAETQLSINCTYENLSAPATVVGVGFGAPVGGVGSSIVGTLIINGGQSGTVSLTIPLTAQRLADLRSNRTYIYINNQSATEIRGQIHLSNSAYNDFDGDGRTDVTVYRESNSTFYSLSSLTRNLVGKQIGVPTDTISLTVDYDGDGRSDFSTTRYTPEILWRIFKSTTNTLEETRWGSSSLFDFLAAADYDGDGAFDIAVYRGGVWYILESSTGNARIEYFGTAGDFAAPNDFDKDGKADLAVTRNEGGQRKWYVRRSTDGTFFSLPWGLGTDGYFIGRTDWDGDGANDITVLRNEGGQSVFYILRSSDAQLQVIRWGLSSDAVRLGDYDGDGKTDAAVTRAVNGQKIFYILQSSTGEPRYETFGLDGDL